MDAAYDMAHARIYESGADFPSLAVNLVTAAIPSAVDDWPTHASKEPDRALFVMNNAGLYDDDGVVYDLATRKARIETLHYWDTPLHRHPALGLPRLKPSRKLDGLSLFMGGLGGQTFYHFFIDHLPQLALLRAYYPEARRIIVQAYIEEPKVAWLRHAGCTLPIEWLHPLDHLLCERLAFTSRATNLYHATPWSLSRLRELVGCLPAEPAGGPRRFIWADRRSANVRATSWEQDIIAGLPEPWEAVDFGKLTPGEVMTTMAACAGFAGFHGAAFANLALAPANTKVLEVFRAPNYAWYPSLSHLCGHDHRVLFADSTAQIPAVFAALSTMA